MRRPDASEPWERFARDDPEYYVQTPKAGQQPWTEHGESLVEEMLQRVSGLLPSWSHAIEIGCGPGRLTVPVAQRFENVTAVDVAPTMLLRLAENCRERNVSNVTPMTPDQAWDEQGAGFVYSVQVFQHIPDVAVIARYIERAARALEPQGVAYLHFDSRPATALYRARSVVPDPLLPRPWRRDIRRVRRPIATIAALVERAGLTTIAEYAPSTQNHVIVATPTAAP